MGFFIQRSNFVQVNDLIKSITDDMVANGFTRMYPDTPMPEEAPTTFKITLEATAAVDTLAANQKWRVHFNVQDIHRAKMYVAADTQLPNDGTTSTMERGLNLTNPDSAGVIGTDLPYPYKQDATTVFVGLIQDQGSYIETQTYTAENIWRTKRINNADSQFIDRSVRIPDLQTAQSYPMSYVLSITSRGFALCVWEEQQDYSGTNSSWVVVQRPVDRNNGNALVDLNTKNPLFCVYGIKDKYIPAAIKPNTATSGSDNTQIIYPERWESGIKKFVVRERDVYKPTPSVPATYDSEDSNAIINGAQQVSITEDNKYVLTFPNKLNTPRYSYTHELDMLAYTSADVVSQHTEVPITVYGEATQRVYQAMIANGPNNTKMRLLLLKSGGGV